MLKTLLGKAKDTVDEVKQKDEAQDDYFPVLIALTSRVSGIPVEKLESMSRKDLLDYILLGYWPNEQHLSIRRKNNERMTKHD